MATTGVPLLSVEVNTSDLSVAKVLKEMLTNPHFYMNSI